MAARDADFTRNVFRLQRAIRRDIAKTPHERVVATDILDLVDWNLGYAYPSQEHLAETLGIDIRTVRKAIANIVVDDPPTIAQQLGTRYFRRAKFRRSHKYYPLMTPRKGIITPEANARVANQQHAFHAGETPEANACSLSATPENDARTPEANAPRTPEANAPLSTLSDPLEEPLSAAQAETIVGEATPEGGPTDDGVIAPGQCTFSEFWDASGQIGEWGPAWGLWSKLEQADLAVIGRLVLGGGEIDTGGAWAVTWLRARGWENATPKRRKTIQRAAAELSSELEGSAFVLSHEMLKPYSEEWKREHARRISAGEPVGLMESWAREGRGFGVRSVARRAS